MDVLEPLEPWKSHYFYPAARDRIMTLKRVYGYNYALRESKRLAVRFEDAELEKRLRG